MRAIGYIRVSTVMQEETGLGMEAQATAIEREANHRGWELVGTESDVISAGDDLDDRAGLERAVIRIEAGEADALVIARVDRLVRSVADLATLLDRARKAGWSVVCLDIPGVDTTTATGELIVTILAAVARWERRIIGERTSAALRAKAARGERVGADLASSPEVMSMICRMWEQNGWGYKRIAVELNDRGIPAAQGGVWHPNGVRRVVTRHRRLVENGGEGLVRSPST